MHENTDQRCSLFPLINETEARNGCLISAYHLRLYPAGKNPALSGKGGTPFGLTSRTVWSHGAGGDSDPHTARPALGLRRSLQAKMSVIHSFSAASLSQSLSASSQSHTSLPNKVPQFSRRSSSPASILSGYEHILIPDWCERHDRDVCTNVTT